MVQIELKGLHFKAFHGVHEFERREGNNFIVDLWVDSSAFSSLETDNLEDTVDYEQLYALVAREMAVTSNLLENVAARIAKSILNEIAEIDSVKVRIAKKNPPISGKCEESAVTYIKKR